MTVSIIIAVKTWQRNLEECVARCRELDYPDFEIIILPDDPMQGLSPKGTVPVQIISTGPVSPAKKRDLALQYAKGEILAFIDDDAYPIRTWLKEAVKNFDDLNVAVVGGPALTPIEDNILQKASGRIYESILVSGNFRYRYLAQKRREVQDLPSCNFLIRKSVMLALGLTSNQELLKPLRESFGEVYVVGDCVEPRKIYQAIHEGAFSGRAI